MWKRKERELWWAVMIDRVTEEVQEKRTCKNAGSVPEKRQGRN